MNVKFNGGRNLYSSKIPKKLCGRTGGFARIIITIIVIVTTITISTIITIINQ